MEVMMDDAYWMGLALREAKKAAKLGEVPIGAVIVREGTVLAVGYNLREAKQDPTAHAEIIAIRKASRKNGGWRLTGTTMYVTLEPCVMCMGAILLARFDRVVFGCHDPKGGAAGSLYDLSDDARLNHRVELTAGVREEECSGILSDFFANLRKMKKMQRTADSKTVKQLVSGYWLLFSKQKEPK
jgi:tRNA(adenine34) deaminase